MLTCPVCGEDIAPWFIPVADAPQVLGISPEEIQEMIDQKVVGLRVDISMRHPVPLIDLLTLRSLPDRVHETMKHMNRPF